MHIPETTKLAPSRFGLIVSVSFLIAFAVVLSLRSNHIESAVEAAPAQAEKKVTVNGVDSTRIDYDLDTDNPGAGVFQPDPTDDDRDFATGSKIKTIRVLRQDGTELPNATRQCQTQNCTVVVNTNRGQIRVADAGSNVLALTFPQRQTYRYSCSRRGSYSKKVNVQTVTLSNPTATIACPGNRCTAEITYTFQ